MFSSFEGAVYDMRHSYTDVFFVVGCVYLVDTAVFGAIPIIQRRRERLQEAKDGLTDLDNKNYETLRITKCKTNPSANEVFPSGINANTSNPETRDNFVTTAALYVQGPVPTTMTSIVKQQEQQPNMGYEGNIPFGQGPGLPPTLPRFHEFNQQTAIPENTPWQADFDE